VLIGQCVGTVLAEEPLVPLEPTSVWDDLISLPAHAGATVRIDGVLDEPVWRELPARDQFVVLEPDTLRAGVHQTLIRIFYTPLGLYIGADLRQPPNTRIGRLSGRDNRELNRDSVNVTLDTSGQGLYGYWFGINFGGSLSDGTVLPERQYSNDWDGPWRGASAETSTGWSAEFFIPWSTVAMPASGLDRPLGLYLSRKVAYLDERWGWPVLPFTQPRLMSALQKLEVHDVAPRQQYNLYPFIAATVDEYDDDSRRCRPNRGSRQGLPDSDEGRVQSCDRGYRRRRGFGPPRICLRRSGIEDLTRRRSRAVRRRTRQTTPSTPSRADCLA
jgi:hypothetical protein